MGEKTRIPNAFVNFYRFLTLALITKFENNKLCQICEEGEFWTGS